MDETVHILSTHSEREGNLVFGEIIRSEAGLREKLSRIIADGFLRLSGSFLYQEHEERCVKCEERVWGRFTLERMFGFRFVYSEAGGVCIGLLGIFLMNI